LQKKVKENCLLIACFLAILLFDPDHGGDMFLGNVVGLLQKFMALQSRRSYSSWKESVPSIVGGKYHENSLRDSPQHKSNLQK
jgi:hypothetical protein